MTKSAEANKEKEKNKELLKQKLNKCLINYFNYLLMSAALLILIIGALFFVAPQFRKIADSQLQAKNKLAEELNKKSEYLNKITTLKKIYDEVDPSDREKITAMIPADSNLVNLIPELESIIHKNSAILTSIKVDSEESKNLMRTDGVAGQKPALAGIFSAPLPGGVKLVKLEINIDGASYQILKNVLRALENNLRLLDVSKIGYNASENKAVLTIYSYYLQI